MAKKIIKDKYLLADKIIRYFLLGIWSLLLIFGLLTLIQPQWLVDLSKPGRKEEAQGFIEQGNVFLYQSDQNRTKANLENAISNYQKALSIDSLNITAIANMGVVYLYLDELEEAKLKFEQCLSIDSLSDYFIYAYLGDYYERIGDIEKALEYYLQSAKTHPNPAYPLRKAGLYSAQLHRYDEAISLLNQSIDLEKSFEHFYRTELNYAKLRAIPVSDTININIINEILKKEDLSSYLTHYDAYIFDQTHKISKDIGHAYMYMGDVYAYKNDYKAAVENYQLCLKYFPGLTSKVKDKLAYAMGKVSEIR